MSINPKSNKRGPRGGRPSAQDDEDRHSGGGGTDDYLGLMLRAARKKAGRG